MSDPVESYFSELRDIRSSGAGVAEISYYDPLKQLLNEVGKHLKPKVRALMQLRNAGSGNPDGGLFTANQLKGWEPGVDPLLGQLPARGAIEVKGTSDDAFTIAESEQVARYVERYGLVLVTNLRDFVLVGKNVDGTGVRQLETCRLATTETSFWAKIQQPRKYAEEAGEGLTEFLRRVLLHNAPLSDPKDIAWYLASYARTSRLRLEQKHELPALDALRNQLEESLGLKFEGDKGDHFFRSTLVQTLFYGMFASWVLWARDMDHTQQVPWESRFQWETATATLHVPMVYELFRQFADVRQLGALGISEVLEWAEEVLWRIDRKSFFEKFREEHAVQYFYEPFLEAFDPQLRKELGVWYTPDEVVKYMVARVDWALREELGIADGLADPGVVVLDPCCGTGAYLVEVLRKIDETLQAKGADALTRQDVKRAAMERVIGFEIMPAPFVVAHLQLGILLAELGVPLRDAEERAAVYLTNALTGWGDGTVMTPEEKRCSVGQVHSPLLFPEFAEERDAADRVKREEQILVVIGNPPYNGFAGVAQDEEASLLEPFKKRMEYWGVKKNKIDDLYLRFFAMAVRGIGIMSGRGVVSFISNDSWLSGPSYVTVREVLLGAFDSFWVEGMHGDRSMSEHGPDGRTSQTVFAVSGFSQGIRQGVAISTWVKRGLPDTDDAIVRYRQDLNDSDAGTRRLHLLATLHEPGSDDHYQRLCPTADNKLSFKPFQVDASYMEWPTVADIAGVSPLLGLNENRGETLIDSSAVELRQRMQTYFDGRISTADLPAELDGLRRDWARFDGLAARRRLLSGTTFDASRIRRFQVKPFDWKWAYIDASRPLWNEPRPDLQAQLMEDAEFVLVRVRAPKENDGAAFGFATGAFDQHALHKDAYAIPTTLITGDDPSRLFADHVGVRPNLSERALQYVSHLGLTDEVAASRLLWSHVLAVGFSPTYLADNGHGIASEWPRIPLPMGRDAVRDSATLGARIACLLNPDAAPREVPLRVIAILTSSTGSALSDSDLGVRAQWGLRQRAGVVTPSKGRLNERPYSASESHAIGAGAEAMGVSADEAIALLGETCFDVYLNDVAYWSCVPTNVWHFTIGGYQVIKKWLSYRERAVLGRDLKPEEARHVTEMVRRIASLVLMAPELDANYQRAKSEVWEWAK
ncbi:MAG: type ISP restriction/modification enzyme [Coriobacteriia bacterium]